MEKVLVTGGAGFIGNAVVEQLRNRYEVIVLDNFSEQIHGEDYKKSYLYQRIKDKCKVIKGDICNYDDLSSALEGVDYIIHLAAETGTGQSMYEINRYTDVNIKGTSNLLEAIMKNKLPIKKIILSSSRSVYGEGMYSCEKHGIVVPNSREVDDMKKGDFETKCPTCGGVVELRETTEESLLTPISYYAYTKLAQEKMLEVMCPTMNIPYTVFRYQNVYGAGQSLNNPYTGILSIFSKLLLKDKDLNIFEDGKESRDFIHVKDVAKATCSALENTSTNYQYINLGSGVNISVKQVAETLKKLYGSNSKIEISGDFRKGDIRHNIADIKKATNLLGFEPIYTFEKGMEEFTAWVKKQYEEKSIETTDDLFERSLNEMKETGILVMGKE
ncbi:NAD-dependent epimerase/dehydratase family protein [Aquibacillus koreensis]|uniref:NAD-dependent epimerase/dehydratase family protein n=1 Tax=Aquibacillus koreensis TaxID=279446 RepID=A0A9X4AHB8_9BACI|nr:NAD-dependent epimerase/dehydratase family protein [Aquibacillus koreensis]MCT2534632.1 NAD-dependent epimerase/dehydratase family protein [Aquibacillus koreensis]MDC3419816.1 NAD-dependent epimerase/dehydratase family protein [Aquibacillus koreensis]